MTDKQFKELKNIMITSLYIISTLGALMIGALFQIANNI